MRKNRMNYVFTVLLIMFIGGCSESIATPEEVFSAFALAWEQGDYEAMYESLSNSSKALISSEEFIELYTTTYTEINASEVSISLTSPERDEDEEIEGNETSLQFEKDLIVFTGEIKLDSHVSMMLDEEASAWKVDWSPDLIFPLMEMGDRVKLRILYPSERGEILDRNGEALAINGSIYEIGVVPSRIENEEEEISQLSERIGVSEEFIIDRLNQGWVGPDTYVPIKKISEDQKPFVEELHSTIPFATYKKIGARVYPAGKASAHLIGYLGMVSKKELEEDTERAYHANSTTGKAGLEQIYENRLRGQSGGEIYLEANDGTEKHVIQKKEPINGESIQLTIDRTLQQAVFDKFNQEGDTGTGVAVHPLTGEVLTLVNSPAYDPNEFILGISQNKYSELENDPKKPLINRFAQAFVPGSTIKPITAAIVLKNGLDPDEKIASTDAGWRKDGSWGNHTVRRVPNPLQQLNLTEAMMYSDNIYFAKVAVELGIDDFEQGLTKLGFEKRMPFVYGFSESQIAAKKLDSDILLADTAYGQGELLVNPLHLAMLYTTFLNDGSTPKPLLLMTEEKEWWLEETISKEHSDIVLQSLIEVIENPSGTASNVRLDEVKLAGKTGTAEHKLSREDEEGIETGWFVAMDIDNRDLLMLMMVEEGGSSYAALKVKELFQEYYTD
ncbi:penicillin-binding transpeptidase domain-containing protein [Alkalihalobacillus deserti]|uniref:penicillin-binding transpeptidase domain-containing protein n=1 Tax=Alkalihalobacillus deserti TaxID=2879466 RepID=UPI001D1519B1|nr:penicillin-binding transpeptidase domain-containing protein [Alkalihalobacillus deserti]